MGEGMEAFARLLQAPGRASCLREGVFQEPETCVVAHLLWGRRDGFLPVP